MDDKKWAELNERLDKLERRLETISSIVLLALCLATASILVLYQMAHR